MSASGLAASRSKRRVVYRRSGWAVHEFSVWGGGALVCRAAALRMRGSLLLWVGGAAPSLGALALGLPGGDASLLDAGGDAERGAAAAALARRLAAKLRRPVWVAAAQTLDRFSAPLVTRGLVAEIKSRPDFFNDPDQRVPSDAVESRA